MIAFVQPFSVDGKAGGARILRTLLRDAPEDWVSINTVVGRGINSSQNEVWIPGRPLFAPIDRFRRLQNVLSSNLDIAFGNSLERRLVEFCSRNGVRAIHAIPHGIDFWYAYTAAKKMGIPYFLNVHDELYYNLRGVIYLPYAMKRLKEVWNGADGIFVISKAMGEEYSERYGRRDYEVVTDGLSHVADAPRELIPNRLRVYMMGSAHISYRANFDVLLQGLDLISKSNPELDVSLTVRGGFPYSRTARTPVIELPWGTQEDVEGDLVNADILYLPLPFEDEFAPLARFSLATKLVTYLGTGLPILYHGPEYAAASQLLAENDAAIRVEQNNSQLLASTILGMQSNTTSVVANALALARGQFMVDDQRERFWSAFNGAAS